MLLLPATLTQTPTLHNGLLVKGLAQTCCPETWYLMDYALRTDRSQTERVKKASEIADYDKEPGG